MCALFIMLSPFNPLQTSKTTSTGAGETTPWLRQESRYRGLVQVGPSWQQPWDSSWEGKGGSPEHAGYLSSPTGEFCVNRDIPEGDSQCQPKALTHRYTCTHVYITHVHPHACTRTYTWKEKTKARHSEVQHFVACCVCLTLCGCAPGMSVTHAAVNTFTGFCPRPPVLA